MNSKLDKQRLFNQLFLEVMKWAYSYSIYQWPIFINKFKWRAKQDNSISLYLCVPLIQIPLFLLPEILGLCHQKIFSHFLFPYANFEKKLFNYFRDSFLVRGKRLRFKLEFKYI